jgi:hypothetical protein
MCSLIGSRWALVVVVDEHGQSVLIPGQALETQGADLLRAPSGVDGQLDTGAHLR